jgi:hypothetical protein
VSDNYDPYAPPKAAVADIKDTELWDDSGPTPMPRTVRIAVVLLWIAVSLYGLGVVLNWKFSPYSKFTFLPGLAFWVTVNYFIGKRSRPALIILVVCTFLIVPVLAGEDYLSYIGRPIPHAPYYFPRLVTVFACRGAATCLLFTQEARAWYERRRPSASR